MRHIIMAAALCGLSSTALAEPFAGAYLGGQLGGSWIGAEADASGYNAEVERSVAPQGTVQAGYNWAIGNTVLGVQGFGSLVGKNDHDYSITDASGNTLASGRAEFGADAYGLTGLVGIKNIDTMTYAKLGMAWAQIKDVKERDSNTDLGDSERERALYAALGVEYLFNPHLGLQTEASYIRYSDRLTVENTAVDYNISNISLTLGLNYRF
ncbi:outer membrane protein [Thermithiobacillus plumbiphilus]|uniref:Outer membrane beta-barrel protein n=1 Tax=Thermithiobacillus plumbiphilus TaxID=1729899 RepID=A0ABU9D7Y2_9PROT